MHVGALCRCIKNFEAVMPDELSLYDGDLFQVLSKEDRYWVHGVSGGGHGKVPISCIAEVNITDLVPPTAKHGTLFAVSSDFTPQEEGDLPLLKGTVVVGEGALDDAWWRGSAYGKTGVFPLNFVWQINMDIMQVKESGERNVSKLGRALHSFVAQLDEELTLAVGDSVHITAILEEDWCRGLCNGRTGIFPSNFVKITEENFVDSSTTVSSVVAVAPVISSSSSFTDDNQNSLAQISSTQNRGSYLDNSSVITTSEEPNSNNYSQDILNYIDPNKHLNDENAPVVPSDSLLCCSGDFSTNDCISNNNSLKKNQLDSASHAADSRRHTITSQNIPTDQSSSDNKYPESKLSKISTAWKDSTDDNSAIFQDDYFKVNLPGYYQETVAAASDAAPSSVCQSKPPSSSIHKSLSHASYSRDSITRKVDDYFDHRAPLRPSMSTNTKRGVVNSSRYDQQVDEMLQIGYNEDNTGINPYAKAIYDFSAQYPNELRFQKDEIIHLVKHIDSHWTLGMIGEERGIFPTSYVDIIVDCVDGSMESFLMRPMSTTEIPKLEGYAVADHSYVAAESGDVSISEGETLKVLEFIDANWAIVETTAGNSGMCPRNHFSILSEEEIPPMSKFMSAVEAAKTVPCVGTLLPSSSEIMDHNRPSSELTRSDLNSDVVLTKRVYGKRDFGPIQMKQLDEELNKNITSLDQGWSNKSSKSKESFAPDESLLPQTETTSKSNENILDIDVGILEQLGRVSIDTSSAVEPSELDCRSAYPPVKTMGPIRPPLPDRTSLKSRNTFTSSFTPATGTIPEHRLAPSLSTPIPDFSTSKTTATVVKPAVARKPNVLSRQAAIVVPEATVEGSEDTPPATFDLLTGDGDGVLPDDFPKDDEHQIPSELILFSEDKSVAPLETAEKTDSLRQRTPSKSSSVESSAAEFPADILHESVSSRSSYTRSSSGLAPLRPAPPPPARSLDRSKSLAAPLVSSVSSQRSVASIYPGVELSQKAPPDNTETPSNFSRGSAERHTIAVSSLVDGSESIEAAGVQRPGSHEEGGSFGGRRSASNSHKMLNVSPSRPGSRGSNSSVRSTNSIGTELSGPTAADKAERLAVMRREAVQELLTTEIEYIHDLEALIQVSSSTASRAKEASVDVSALLGNLDQVILTAKSLQRSLQRVAFEPVELQSLGAVFLSEAGQLCQVYKTYCADHTTVVEPLLSQYQQQTNRRQYMEHVLQELQQHKIQLLDMRSVLIKPVQRILKYPLFLDRLLSYTLPDHPDYALLQEATQRMATVATEVNSHTKRMDMVRKYGHPTAPDSFSSMSKMSKFTLHSLAKKGARVTTRLTASLGLSSLTEDVRMSQLEAEYRGTMAGVRALEQQARIVRQLVAERHKAEVSLVEGLSEALLTGQAPSASSPAIEAIRNTVRDVCNNVLAPFESAMDQSVLQPLCAVCSMTATTDRLLQKREHKLLDFDRAQHKMDRNRDPARTRILEEELSRARSDYEALHSQLLEELPLFCTSASAVLATALTAYLSVRTALQGRLAKRYCGLKQSLTSQPGPDSQQQQIAACEKMSRLSFVPDGHFAGLNKAADSSPSPRTSRKKTSLKVLPQQSAPLHQSGHARAALFTRYGARPGMLHQLTGEHRPTEPLELPLPCGAVVAVLKTKDPLGSSARWFVDDGERTGFVPALLLRPCQSDQSQPQASPPQQQPQHLPSSLPRPYPQPLNPTIVGPVCHLPHPDFPRGENPPSYEDLFPGGPRPVPAIPTKNPAVYSMARPEASNQLPAAVLTTAPVSAARLGATSVISGSSTIPRVSHHTDAGVNQPMSLSVNTPSHADTCNIGARLRASSSGSAASKSVTDEASNNAASGAESVPKPRSSSVPHAHPGGRDGVVRAGDGEAVNLNGSGDPCHYDASNDMQPEQGADAVDNVYEEIASADEATHHVYEDIEDDGEEEEEDDDGQTQFYYALYKYGGEGGSNQLSLYEGQVVLLLRGVAASGDGRLPSAQQWYFVENRDGEQGYVPASYLAPYSP